MSLVVTNVTQLLKTRGYKINMETFSRRREALALARPLTATVVAGVLSKNLIVLL